MGACCSLQVPGTLDLRGGFRGFINNKSGTAKGMSFPLVVASSVCVPLYLQPPAARCLHVPGRYLCMYEPTPYLGISAPSAKPRMTRHQGNSPPHWLKLFHPAKFQQSPSPQFIITISDSQRLQGSDQSSEGSQREALIAHLCLLLAFQKRNDESA